MKRRRLKLIFAAVWLLGLFILVAPAQAQDPQDFTFDSFNGDYRLSRAEDKSSRLDVEETLVARFPAFDQNHGILRAIPASYQDHTLSLKILSVTDESGKPYNYTTYKENENLVLKIGDADKFVHGQVTYNIHYSMSDVINIFADHDEFFWDINGDQWSQPFKSVTGRIIIPSSLESSLNENRVCYTGAFGSRVRSCEITRQNTAEGTAIAATASNLQPRQTLSVALSFQPRTFELSPAVKREQLLNKLSLVGGGIFLAGIPLYAGLFMYRRWRQFGDDPKGRGVIVPQYEQPKGLDALSADYLVEQKLRPQAVSAMLLELAVAGYINVYEIPKKGLFGKKDYEVELLGVPKQASAPVKDALTAVFGHLKSGVKVPLSQFKKDRTHQMEMYKGMQKLDNDLPKFMHAKGYFIKNPKAVKNGYQIWSLLIFIAGFGLAFLGFSLSLWAVVGAGFGLILASIVVFIYAHVMPARTQLGVYAYDELLGLKDYIKLAEADRIKFLQSPEGAEKIIDPGKFNPKTNAAKIKLFESLLPYAMLFGLEKDWAKQFKGIYTHPSSWYHGNAAAFNAGYLGSSMSDFRAAGAGSFTTPSSSSGSGFSSGGGAGGGGGGGGGGGW